MKKIDWTVPVTCISFLFGCMIYELALGYETTNSRPILLGLIIGYFVRMIQVPKLNVEFETRSTMGEPRPTRRIHERHREPKYYGYEGGFTKTHRCSGCGTISLSEDAYLTKPCVKCGGKVTAMEKAAKWVVDVRDNLWKWMTPEQIEEAFKSGAK